MDAVSLVSMDHTMTKENEQISSFWNSYQPISPCSLEKDNSISNTDPRTHVAQVYTPEINSPYKTVSK